MSSLDNSPKLSIGDYVPYGQKEIARGNFMNLLEYHYTDPLEGDKTWEVAGRCHKPEGATIDCVSSLAILRRLLKYDCVILVKQYRPALEAYTLEFPAGLVNIDEKTEETGLRELKEETGYTGTNVKHISSVTAMDPGLSNSTMKMVTVDIDGDALVNHIPVQSLADTEKIDVVHIPVRELLFRLNEYAELGTIIDSRVYSFAVGMAMGIKLADVNTSA